MPDVFDKIGIGKSEMIEMLPALRLSEVAYATGSVIAGFGTADSDIDIIVICEDSLLNCHLEESIPESATNGRASNLRGFDNADRAPIVHYRYGPRLVDIEFYTWTRFKNLLNIQTAENPLAPVSIPKRLNRTGLFFAAALSTGVPVWNDGLYEELRSSIDIDRVFSLIGDLNYRLASEAIQRSRAELSTSNFVGAYFHAEQAVFYVAKTMLAAHRLFTNDSWIYAAFAKAFGSGHELLDRVWELTNKQIQPTRRMVQYVAEVETFVRLLSARRFPYHNHRMD